MSSLDDQWWGISKKTSIVGDIMHTDTIQCGLNVVVNQGFVTYIFILGLVIYCPQIDKDQDMCITGKGNWIRDMYLIDISSAIGYATCV